MFSGVAITSPQGKKSILPEAKQSSCFFLRLSVHVRAVVASSSLALWCGLLSLITLSLTKAKPGQLVCHPQPS